MYDAVREDERECLYFHDRYELSAEIDLAPALIALALGPRGWRVHAWVAGNVTQDMSFELEHLECSLFAAESPGVLLSLKS